MKRISVLMLAVAALAFPAAQASAASSASPSLAQFKALQKQVASLQAQVKAMQKWVPKSCNTNTCFTLPQVSVSPRSATRSRSARPRSSRTRFRGRGT